VVAEWRSAAGKTKRKRRKGRRRSKVHSRGVKREERGAKKR